jgi:hypothetical protein
MPAQRWTTEADIKLKNWPAIAAVVQDRAKEHCLGRWRLLLDPCFDRTSRGTKLTSNKDEKLKAAEQMHVRKNWIAITAMVPGRTKSQCSSRWRKHLDPSRS